MKKILITIGFLICFFALTAQNSTIVDNGPYITLQYDDGDTVSLGKSAVIQVRDEGNNVFIMTARKWTPGNLTKIASLNYSDFGYSTAGTLRDYLAVICFQAYDEAYNYTDGNMDTVSYSYSSTVQYYMVYGYTNDTLTSKKIVVQ